MSFIFSIQKYRGEDFNHFVTKGVKQCFNPSLFLLIQIVGLKMSNIFWVQRYEPKKASTTQREVDRLQQANNAKVINPSRFIELGYFYFNDKAQQQLSNLITILILFKF